MIIDSGPDKDIEATADLTSPRPALVEPSASTSASAVPNHQYDYAQVDDAADENDRLLSDTSLPLPGALPTPVFPNSGPQYQEPLGPPPEFTPYEAEWFEVSNGDVVSHDEHLNTDGEALYRFLLTQASQRPPGYRIHCRGTHTETRYRFVTSYDNTSHHSGHSHSHRGHPNRTESYTESVTDFDFYIDVTPPFSSQNPTSLPPVDSKTHTSQPHNQEHTDLHDDYAPIHWSVADNEPVYRGKMIREVETLDSSDRRGPISLPEGDLPLLAPGHLSQTGTQSRKASRTEQKDYTEWIKQRTRKGIPPWTLAPGLANSQWSQAAILAATDPTNVISSDHSITPPHGILKSSRTVRQWADSYCSSPKLLKEFVYTKLLYGWDLTQLESAIRSTIALAPYHGDIQVTFTPINSKIYIRSSNRLSRTLSNVWLKFISVLLLIYPFVWLFKMFHSKGGGKWDVCGSAYALKRWIPLNRPSATSMNQGSSGSSLFRNSELPSYEDTVAGPSTLSPTVSSSAPLSPLTTTTRLTTVPSLGSSPSMFSPHPHLNPQPQTRIVQTPSGPYKLIGQREGEWFRHWEPVILRAVITRYQSTVPLTSHNGPHGQRATPGSALEGYHDSPNGAGVAPSGGGLPVPALAPDRFNSAYGPISGSFH